MKDSILETGFECFLKSDDIVVRCAKIIDPGAFSLWTHTDENEKETSEYSTRQKYMQSRAVCMAVSVLKEALTEKDLRTALAESEKASWKLLGVPIDNPKLSRIVDAKYT